MYRSAPFRRVVGWFGAAQREATAIAVASKATPVAERAFDEVESIAFGPAATGRGLEIKFRALLQLLKLAGVSVADPAPPQSIVQVGELNISQIAVNQITKLPHGTPLGPQSHRLTVGHENQDRPPAAMHGLDELPFYEEPTESHAGM